MIRSMTGFGEVQLQTAVGRVSVQIRTVNHRHFHTHFSLPAFAERWEGELTQILRESIARGHVHLRLNFEPGPDSVPPLRVDQARLRAYLAALAEIKGQQGISGEVDLGLIARFSDIFQAPPVEAVQVSLDDVAPATRGALAGVIDMRAREGKALAADLDESLEQIKKALATIETRAPQRLIEERDRLRAAVAELSADVEIDEERLAREVAFLAERWDINEEIVRLRSHLDEFGRVLADETTEPAGKRLGFWVQEMHRETNTIGSKSNDAEIARQVVEIKTAIERLREQVENIE
jgi:uncharacterized protein (TIGR00255 family)